MIFYQPQLENDIKALLQLLDFLFLCLFAFNYKNWYKKILISVKKITFSPAAIQMKLQK